MGDMGLENIGFVAFWNIFLLQFLLYFQFVGIHSYWWLWQVEKNS